MTDFKWVGPKVDCYNPALEKGWFDFYKSFYYKGDTFNLGDFALVSQSSKPNKIRICKLLCLYHSHEKWNEKAKFRGSVRWFTWTKDLDSKFNTCGIKFDFKSEVVEDTCGSDIFISLENIQKKCKVIFGGPNYPISLIKHNGFDPDVYFFCRYKIQYSQIIPYSSEEDNMDNKTSFSNIEHLRYTDTLDIEADNYRSAKKISIGQESPLIKAIPVQTSPTKYSKYKRKPSHKGTPVLNLDSEGSDVEETDSDKIKSPSNPKNMKLTPRNKGKKLNESILSPSKRNMSVRRVLNDSFESPITSPSGIPIFSYSVINQNIDDNKSIKLKFKLNEKKNDLSLKVFPTKLDDKVARLKSPIKLREVEEVENRIILSQNETQNIDTTQTPTKIGLTRRQSNRINGASTEYFSPYRTPAKIDLPRRRSSRTTERKLYTECYSPEEYTPKKSIRRKSTDSNRSVSRRTPFRDVEEKLSNITEDEDWETVKLIEDVKGEHQEHKIKSEIKLEDFETNTVSGSEILNKNISACTNNLNNSESIYKAIKNLTPIKEGNRNSSITYINDDIDGECIKDFSERKRKVGRPKRYDVEENMEVTPNRSKRHSRKCLDSIEKSTNGNHTASRSVGRPVKYINNNDDTSNTKSTPKQKYCIESDNYTSLRPRRIVNPPKKYMTDSDNDSINEVSSSKAKNYYSSSKNQISDDNYGSRPKRSVGPPRKYVDTDESDSSDSVYFSTKPKKSQINSSTKKVDVNSAQKLRRSVLQSASKKLVSANSNHDDSQPKTPSTPKRMNNRGTPKSNLKDTPSARAKMVREGIITPSVQARKNTVIKENTPLSKARTQLHVSYIPKALPCREKEFADIISFLEGKLLDGCGGCMYISGVPGTGKTATVTEVINVLSESAENGDVPSFKYININGMKLSEPRQAYVQIVKQLMEKTVSWEQAQTMLENKFVKSQKKSAPIVLVVDELDILCTKRQDVVYNLLDWPTKANAQLIVITIANTMDLPERLLMGRVTSRLGLTRLTFQAYTHKQLQDIVTKRLSGTNAFNPDAIQLVARKVASVSGDARRALDICRRAAEIAELEGKNILVSMIHVNQALNAMITQPKVQAIKRCSRLEKLILQAIVAEVERTGVEETNFVSILRMLVTLAALEGFQMVSNTIVMGAVAKLGACRLLLIDQKCNNIYQRIILNVSADDVYYALTKTNL